MIVAVISVYAAIAATIVAMIIRLYFGLTGRMEFWNRRGRFWIVLMQLALGIAYMTIINLDTSPTNRWGWEIALICGAVGGLLSLLVVLPLFKRSRLAGSPMH